MQVTFKCCISLLLLYFLAISASVNAQPSSSTYMAVRLYDKHGRVKPARFAREYQMYDCMDHGPEGVPLELGHNMSYSKKDKLYYFSVSAIYAPYLLRICHHNDTMELILPDSYLAFEKLVFHPGLYMFSRTLLFPKSRVDKTGQLQTCVHKAA